MRRVVFALALIALGWSAASAAGPSSQSVSEAIALPAYGTPAIARTLYTQDSSTNGLLGYIIQLTVKSGTFNLSAVNSLTTLADFDIYFYSDLNSSSPTGSFFECSVAIPQCPKSGAIPGGSKYAVVVLSVGADETFLYTSHI